MVEISWQETQNRVDKVQNIIMFSNFNLAFTNWECFGSAFMETPKHSSGGPANSGEKFQLVAFANLHGVHIPIWPISSYRRLAHKIPVFLTSDCGELALIGGYTIMSWKFTLLSYIKAIQFLLRHHLQLSTPLFRDLKFHPFISGREKKSLCFSKASPSWPSRSPKSLLLSYFFFFLTRNWVYWGDSRGTVVQESQTVAIYRRVGWRCGAGYINMEGSFFYSLMSPSLNTVKYNKHFKIFFKVCYLI